MGSLRALIAALPSGRRGPECGLGWGCKQGGVEAKGSASLPPLLLGFQWVPAVQFCPSAHAWLWPRVSLRLSRRALVRKSRAWVLEKKERRRRQGK